MKKFRSITIVLFTIVLLSSCAKDNEEQVLEEESSGINEVALLINESPSRVLRNQEINMRLVGTSGEDYTSMATFYVNGIEVESSTFSWESEGVYEVYAKYDKAGTITQTASEMIEVFVPKRKILFEDYTGTWCAYCTHMLERIEYMKNDTEHFAYVSIHAGSADPYTFSNIQPLLEYFEVIFVPTGFTNREYFFGFLDPYEYAIIGAGEEVNTSIAISSQLDGNELSVNVDVISESGLSSNNKLVVMVLESGLIYDQASASNDDPESLYYQMGNPIPDFVHDNVLRACLTDLFGDSIPETPAFKEASSNFTYTVPNNYDLSKLSIIAFVTDEDNVAINTQFADVNETKGFE